MARYDPYETNRIISQTSGLMLGAGNLGLRKREVDMEEKTLKSRIEGLQEQTKSTQLNSMQKAFNLMRIYEMNGIPKELYSPAMQKFLPGIDVNSVKFLNGGVDVLFKHPETGDQIIMYPDPETGEFKTEKFAGYKASIPDLADRLSKAKPGTPEYKQYKNALKNATKPEIRTTSEGIVSINPRDTESGIQNTGLKPYHQLPATATEDISKLQAIQKDIDYVRSLSPENYSGMIAGRVGGIKEKTGVGVKEQEQLARTSVGTLKKNLFDIGGKVLTYNELKILEPFIPDMKDPPEVFKIKLDNYEREYKNILNSKLKSYGQAGFANVENIKGDQPEWQKPKTTSEAVKLLMDTQGITKEQAIDYIRKNPNAFD